MGDDALAELWRSSVPEYDGYAPAYARIVGAAAEDPELLAVVRDAPPAAHLPNVLLAAVRFLLLGGLEHPLGDIYEGRSTDDPYPAFRDLVLGHRRAVLAVMAERRIQTNEIARCAVILPALAEVARRHGEPLALLDVGTSAGLNLLFDRYRIVYGSEPVGPAGDVPEIQCAVYGTPPVVPSGPLRIDWRAGVDRSPLDVARESDRRWLEACVWPEHHERAARLRQALRLAAGDPPDVRRGDAVDDLPALVAEAPHDAHLCLTTTWVFAFLPPRQRGAFEAALDACDRPVSWIAADAPGVVRDVPGVLADDGTSLAPAGRPGPPPCPLSLVDVTPGAPLTRTLLGWVHPHGAWIDWRA